MDFILGTLVIVLPKDQQKFALIASGARALFGHFRRRHRNGKNRARLAPADAVTLEWSQLTCTLSNKQGSRDLLKNVHGIAKPGRLVAICGPSGSGKTTLLHALSAQLPYNANITLSGYITANGCLMPAAAVSTGFVAQEDLFFSQMTVRETLNLAAELRLPAHTPPEERTALVEGVISRLGLAKSADTPIGDAKTRGLSGGEKKRLSIAVELIARSQLLFLDEPTTGLDAFAAERVMIALKGLADEGKTVICSLHQARSSVWDLISDLCLMSEGRLVYFGPAADALDYFAGLGFRCPEHFNPAEFFADLVAIDHSTPESESESQERLGKLVAAWEGGGRRRRSFQGQGDTPPLIQNGREVQTEMTHAATTGNRLSRQVALLFKRSWRQATRDKGTNVSRAMSQVSSAVVFSIIYWRLGHSQASIQDRMGLLQVSAVGTAMSSLVKTLNVFPKERTIVSRERARSPYPVLPYLLSKLAAELPIGAIFPAIFAGLVYPTTGLRGDRGAFAKFVGTLTLESFSSQALGLAVGAAAPSTEAALAMGPAVILVSIVFGGLFVQSVPKALCWLPKTSLIRVSFKGLCVNEFDGLEFESDEGRGGLVSGKDVLRRLTFDKDSVKAAAGQQVKILTFYYWCTYCILKAKKARYQPLEVPVTQE